MPFAAGVLDLYHMGLADGPTEVHKVTVARQVLGGYQGTNEMFPDYHLIKRRDAALAKYADVLEHEVADDAAPFRGAIRRQIHEPARRAREARTGNSP
jgi:acyl-CoA dehydrogenase